MFIVQKKKKKKLSKDKKMKTKKEKTKQKVISRSSKSWMFTYEKAHVHTLSDGSNLYACKRI